MRALEQTTNVRIQRGRNENGKARNEWRIKERIHARPIPAVVATVCRVSWDDQSGSICGGVRSTCGARVRTEISLRKQLSKNKSAAYLNFKPVSGFLFHEEYLAKRAVVADMSKPELYYDPNSPPVRSVLLTLAALGINDQVDLKLVRLFQREHLNDDFIKLNPLHKVPVFKHDDLVLTDSHAILMYLCDIYGQESQFSLNDPKKRALVNNRLCFNNSILFQRESSVMVQIFHRQISEVTKEHLKPLEEAVDYLETYLSNSKFIACDELTVADLAIVAILSTMETICPIPGSRWPKVVAWYETMKQLPYYHEANQTGLDKLKAKLNAVLTE